MLIIERVLVTLEASVLTPASRGVAGMLAGSSHLLVDRIQLSDSNADTGASDATSEEDSADPSSSEAPGARVTSLQKQNAELRRRYPKLQIKPQSCKLNPKNEGSVP